ncbi:uncharacterized protein [Physcomitrium patens]|uniref:Uncharacterized protein n=2 Tax=Physcomitrium patens TaxID=3218 RepID=A0A2K1IQU0_PHYPA|nr:uncharacterized protein LOC112274109 isoform X2 [Physcomitrium patens]PNR31627.1 hypothetical protein PHYPA_025748 [Physcomitrium patens]|eukprot:XP_024359045.1 uncharacterized protein LOC112274109 isoform X2 [Physcomitrella patens]
MGSLKSRGYISGQAGYGDRAAVPLGKGAGKANVFRILIAVVAVFFLVETIANGLVFLKMRDSDLQGGSLNFFTRASETKTVRPGDDVRFVPRLLLSRGKATMAELRRELRTPVRPPSLAFICPNLALSSLSLFVLSIATGLREIGYHVEVLTLKDGEFRSTWETMGVAVKLLKANSENVTTVDWLNYEGVIAVSLNTKSILDSLAQEPFTKVPVIWVITDDALGRRLGKYKAENSTELITDWIRSFKRADVVVFPDYALPMIYTTMDTGNFFVISGSPREVWTAEEYKLTHSRDSLRAQFEVHPDDSVIAVVGGPFLYNWRWREHALVIRAFTRTVSMLGNASQKGGRRIQLFIIGHGNHSSSYGAALQVMADHLKLKNGTVRYVGAGEDVIGVVWMSDAVVYGSFRDEQAFPPILGLAMSLGRPVIAPNRRAFREQISDGESGVLFPVGDEMKLSEAMIRVLGDNTLAVAIALTGQWKARNMHASNVSLGYGELLESILEFPAEAALPRRLDEAEKSLKGGWRWEMLFPANTSFQVSFQSRMGKRVRENDDVGSGVIDTLEVHWKLINSESRNFAEEIGSHASSVDLEIPSHSDLDEAKAIQEDLVAEKIEREELEWRKEVVQTSLEYITKMIRKTEVRKDELKERSDAEIQRNAQPLTIYEPYHGKGAWPFLHEENTLFRGLSLSTLDRRPGDDDVDAEVRLPGLLNETYYRNLLCEYGAFFSIANRIDLIHRNPWIGFQPWRASSKDVALTPAAEVALVKAISTGRDGDAVYFWARTDGHAGTWHRDSSVEHPEDFWGYCDSVNSGRCREAYSRCWRHMYGLPTTWTDLPPMPADGGTWSAMHSWAMPTPSFVEFMLFARMFVDALDAQYYEEHLDLGRCPFVKFPREGQHCYCGLLDGLVNVWAYHSARRLIYVDPKTGTMEEQHALDSRHGKMWVKFLSRDTLKGMDEDLAQAADDSDLPRERWLWPLTGEVFWEGIFERERLERWRLKMERNQKQKEKQALIRSRMKQQAIGKVVKHPRAGEIKLPVGASQQVD